MPNRWLQLNEKELETIHTVLVLNWDMNSKHKKLADKVLKIMNKKRIKISSAKGKGRNLQYWVCERISDIVDIPYNQSDDQCPIHSREMGQHGLDIILRGKAKFQFPYSIECKSSEQFNLVPTIEQVKSNMIDGTDWLIVHKKRAIPSPIVVMDWYAFEQLVRNDKERN